MIRNPHRFFSLPLLPVVGALVAGATAGGMEHWLSSAAITGVFSALIFSGLFFKRISLPGKALFAVAGCFLIAFFSVYTRIHPILPKNHVTNFAGKNTWIIEGRVLPPLDPGLTRSQVLVSVRALLTHDQRRLPVHGKLRVTVYGPYTQTIYVGDMVRFVSAISNPRPPANPYTFNYRRFLALRRIYAIAKVHDFSQIVVLRRGGGWHWTSVISRMRQHLNRWITASIPAPYNALASAFLIGYRGHVSPAMREIFVRCGTSHLIAISGLHLGIVSVLLFILIRRLLVFFPRIFLYVDAQRITAVLTFVFLLFYLVLTGGRISTIRAFIMAAAFLAVLFFRRTSRLPDILLLAAFVILLFQPQAVFYVSFQLTFAAVGGILLGVARGPHELPEEGEASEKAGVLKKLFLWIGITLLITLLAIAVTFPIATYYFHQSSPMAILANLFGIPYVGFVMLPLGLISLIVYPFSVSLATLLIQIDGFFIKILVLVFRFFAGFPHSRVYVFPFRWYEIVLYYLAFVFTVLAFRSGNRRAVKRNSLRAGVCVALFVILFWVSLVMTRPSITVFSVRRGTYLAACQKDGHATLICQGLGESPYRDDAGWVLIPYLLHKRIRTLDFLVVANDEPVNLRAVKEIVAYKKPLVIGGPRRVLYALRNVLQVDPSGVRWRELPVTFRRPRLKVKLERPGGTTGFGRKSLWITLTLQGFTVGVPVLRRCRRLPKGWHSLKLLVAPAGSRLFPDFPASGKKPMMVQYPVGWSWRNKITSEKIVDLRREGAVIVERPRNKWRLKTFLGYKRRIFLP